MQCSHVCLGVKHFLKTVSNVLLSSNILKPIFVLILHYNCPHVSLFGLNEIKQNVLASSTHAHPKMHLLNRPWEQVDGSTSLWHCRIFKCGRIIFLSSGKLFDRCFHFLCRQYLSYCWGIFATPMTNNGTQKGWSVVLSLGYIMHKAC